MTKDAIFLMIPKRSTRNYRIFEYVEETETRKWRYLANFGNMIKYSSLKLPEVIKPMDNGKFIFFPRETKIRDGGISSFDTIEVWEKNQTLTRSPLKLPINITDKTNSFWILQM